MRQNVWLRDPAWPKAWVKSRGNFIARVVPTSRYKFNVMVIGPPGGKVYEEQLDLPLEIAKRVGARLLNETFTRIMPKGMHGISVEQAVEFIYLPDLGRVMIKVGGSTKRDVFGRWAGRAAAEGHGDFVEHLRANPNVWIKYGGPAA